MTLSEDLYDALRALDVCTEGTADPASPRDVALNIAMLTMVGQDPAAWERHLDGLVELALAERTAGGFRVTDAGYAHIDAVMDAKVQRMRERVDRGLSPFDDDDDDANLP